METPLAAGSEQDTGVGGEGPTVARADNSADLTVLGRVSLGGLRPASTHPGTIIFVAHNNLHLTKLAVKSALAQDIPCDILVVNNNSTDGTGDWLRGQPINSYKPVRQLSLAACWNQALRLCWEVFKRTDALVCNTDIELRPDTYRLLRSHGGPFVTCVSVDSKEQLGPAVIPEPPTGERGHPDYSSFLIQKVVTDRVGWFDEAYYPAYCEDNDYHVRMHRAGIQAVCVDLPFLHHAAATLKNADPAEQAEIRRGADRSRERFRAKYGCLPGTPEYGRLFE